MNSITSKIERLTNTKNIDLGNAFNGYFTEDIFPLEEMRELLRDGLKNNNMPKLGKYTMKMSDRYKLFTRDETVCVHCGQKASFWASQTTEKGTRTHLNLYGINENGMVVIFTKDHIIPKSFGGYDDIDNYQVMCSKCNSKKDNDSDIDFNRYKVIINFTDTFLYKKSPITNTEIILELESVSDKGARVIAKGYISKKLKGVKINKIEIIELEKES
jgi:uncharacterized OB-fold protein